MNYVESMRYLESADPASSEALARFHDMRHELYEWFTETPIQNNVEDYIDEASYLVDDVAEAFVMSSSRVNEILGKECPVAARRLIVENWSIDEQDRVEVLTELAPTKFFKALGEAAITPIIDGFMRDPSPRLAINSLSRMYRESADSHIRLFTQGDLTELSHKTSINQNATSQRVVRGVYGSDLGDQSERYAISALHQLRVT